MRRFSLLIVLCGLTLCALSAPAAMEAPESFTIKVVPLSYARASELAYTLSWIAPPGVRIVAYPPTNSLIISGPPAAVEELTDIIKPSARD